MAKQTVVAISFDGVWLCGKIGKRPFALKANSMKYGPVVHLKERYFFAKPPYEGGVRGCALIRHKLGSGWLSQQDKRVLNALLSFSAQVCPEYMYDPIPFGTQLFIAQVDDEREQWALDYC